MLSRRQIRIKVMQGAYAVLQNKEQTIDFQLNFLKGSIRDAYKLYVFQFNLMSELYHYVDKRLVKERNRYLKSEVSSVDAERLIKNKFWINIINDQTLKTACETYQVSDWSMHQDYLKSIYEDLILKDFYQDYMNAETVSFENDKEFVLQFFRQVIAPNEKLYEKIEEQQLTWLDDLPLINTFILKWISNQDSGVDAFSIGDHLVESSEDVDFGTELLEYILLRNDELAKEIEGKTPNWEQDRIADIDLILLKMAICELLHFNQIPVRVTINEYLEIAKEYSGPKSSIFLNGIMDKLLNEFQENNRIKKVGRGLL
ncbi:MAG: transcription antitermination protein NusB [Flavobacteriaceae bacterium]